MSRRSMKPGAVVKRRPAETVGGIGGAIAAIGAALGLAPRTVAVVATVAAFAPAIVTYIVELVRTARGGE